MTNKENSIYPPNNPKFAKGATYDANGPIRRFDTGTVYSGPTGHTSDPETWAGPIPVQRDSVDPFAAAQARYGATKDVGGVSRPEMDRVDSQRPPRIVRHAGAAAVESTVEPPQNIGPGFLAAVHRGVQEKQDREIRDAWTEAMPKVTEPKPGHYKSSNEKLQALDIAENNNIIRAAQEAGVTVDRWKANRRKGMYR